MHAQSWQVFSQTRGGAGIVVLELTDQGTQASLAIGS
jgi:hypothetical protein